MINGVLEKRRISVKEGGMVEVIKKRLDIESNYNSHRICSKCPHLNDPCCKLPTVIARTKKKDISIHLMIVGMGAGKVEEEKKLPWVGPAGNYLRQILMHIWEQQGILFNVALTNNVRFHPTNCTGKDRPPIQEEISACSEILFHDINFLKPHCILVAGKSASSTFFPDLDDLSVGQLRSIKRSFNHKSIEGEQDIVTTYHPSFLLRNYGRKYRPEERNLYDIRFIDDLLYAIGDAYLS